MEKDNMEQEKQEEVLEVFPNITPVSVKKSAFHTFIEEDFEDEPELPQIIVELMYDFPERSFYLYLSSQSETRGKVTGLLQQYGIILNKTENFYYPHPKCSRNFVRIFKNGIKWEWQRDVIDSEPMYSCITLELSERTRKHFDTQLIVEELEKKEKERHPIMFEPNFNGIGIRGPQTIDWIKRKWNEFLGK